MGRRLVVTYLLVTLVVVLVLEVPLGITLARRQEDDLRQQIERDAVVLAQFSEDTLEGLADEDLQQVAHEYAERTGGRVVIVDDTGQAVGDSQSGDAPDESFTNRPEMAEALAGRVAVGNRRSTSLGEDLVYVAVPVASGGEVHGAVRITYPRSEVDERIRDDWFTLAVVGAVSLGAATVVGLFFARSVTRPLRRLQDAAARLGEGDLASRAILSGGPPEVRALAQAFNETAERLEELVGAQDAFVADASHQLRTPLTALRLRLENLQEDEPGLASDDVGAALDEVARLSRLVDGLLALAHAERQAAEATATSIAVRPVLEERQEVWAPVAAERGVALEIDVDDALRMRATPDRVSQELDNLLANAIEASPAGSSVAVLARREKGSILISVIDDGPGMAASERERAFDRFHSRSPGGSGLGLSIVRKLVLADRGDVSLHESTGGGLEVRVRLPADTP